MDLTYKIKARIKEFLQIGNIEISKPLHITKEEFETIYRSYVKQTKNYLNNIADDNRIGFFCKSAKKESIYAYVYWIMTASLLEIDVKDDILRKIVNKLETCQKKDGLCWDENIINLEYLNGDGWGARHFMPQYFVAIERLKMDLKYPLNYIEPFYQKEILKSFLDSLDWSMPWQSSNVVMNIGVVMFFERRYSESSNAGAAIEVLQKWLLDNIRPDCGMWGVGDINSISFKYELIRGAYHMYSFLIYDNIDIPYREKAIDIILECQNKFGGYDFRTNSSACEDIDAIEPLIRLSLLTPNYRVDEIKESIARSLQWVIQNQMKDGGCVFRLGEKFNYGSTNMESSVNESNLFATWFRTLSICYMYDFFTENNRRYVDIPGYEYPLYR